MRSYTSMLGSCYRFEVCILVPDLWYVRETLILKTWNFKLLIGKKDGPIQADLSNVLIFWKWWREAPGTGSLSLPISSAEMPDTISAVSLKLLLLCVNFVPRYPFLSMFQHHRFHQNWFHQLGLMIIFLRWPILGLFRTAKLYRLPCVTLSSSG